MGISIWSAVFLSSLSTADFSCRQLMRWILLIRALFHTGQQTVHFQCLQGKITVAVMHRVFRSRGDKDCWSTRTATWGQQISEQWESRCIERKDRSDESSTEREQNVKSWSCKGKWDSWAYRKSLGKGFFSQKRRWREGWEKEGEGYLWGAHSDIVWALADQSQRDG